MSEEFVEGIVSGLVGSTAMPKESFNSELQDDSQLLFITISVEGVSDADLGDKRKHITKIMQRLMPKRASDYSCDRRSGGIATI